MTSPCAARESFVRGVLGSSAEHALLLMARRGWPFWAASLVALSELEIVLHLMEAEMSELQDCTCMVWIASGGNKHYERCPVHEGSQEVAK